jgi:CRP-like cAMP-binding protein
MTTSQALGLFGEVYPDGTVLFREGDPGDNMFIIQEGQVEISSSAAGTQAVISTLGKGDFFGEMALLDSQPRCATATVRGSARLMVLARETLLERVKQDPNIVLRLLRNMCERMRSLRQCVEALEQAGPIDAAQMSAAVRAHRTG